jgi:hypothetical protein
MELSPSREAKSCSTIQEIPSALWDRKVHHRMHMKPPLTYNVIQLHANYICYSATSEAPTVAKADKPSRAISRISWLKITDALRIIPVPNFIV